MRAQSLLLIRRLLVATRYVRLMPILYRDDPTSDTFFLFFSIQRPQIYAHILGLIPLIGIGISEVTIWLGHHFGART